VFTGPINGNPDEPCVFLFTTVEAASKFRRRIKPLANKNFPVDLKEQAMRYLLDLWENWEVVYYAVIAMEEDVLIGRLDDLFNKPKAPKSIADAPHRYTGIKSSFPSWPKYNRN
jgi:hypothetical protein